jgi:hypothetical protein
VGWLDGAIVATPPGMRLTLIVPYFALLVCCEGKVEDDARLKACPPAPLPLPEVGTPCDFENFYGYAPPFVLRNGTADPFNHRGCECVDGGIEIYQTTIGCGSGCTSTPCDPALVEGGPCSAPDNGECLAWESLVNGEWEGRVCACDEPGPIWRCVDR